MGLVASAVLYCGVLSWRLKLLSQDHLLRFKAESQNEFRPLLLRLFIVCGLALGLMVITDPNNLFTVVRKNPLMWISIALFYSIFSVYPQEFLYRLFFFERYQSLLKSRRIFLLVNTVVFSLAHLMFWNGLVMLLTLLGGLLFARNYERTRVTHFRFPRTRPLWSVAFHNWNGRDARLSHAQRLKRRSCLFLLIRKPHNQPVHSQLVTKKWVRKSGRGIKEKDARHPAT